MKFSHSFVSSLSLAECAVIGKQAYGKIGMANEAADAVSQSKNGNLDSRFHSLDDSLFYSLRKYR